MIKTTRIVPLVFSVLLLLVFVTASPRARSNPNPAPPAPFEIKGQIRWKKAMGLIPIGPGKIMASNSACSPFFIVAYEYNASFSGGDKVLAYSSRSTSQPTEQEGYYVCDFSMQVPPDKSMFVRAGVGDVDLLPKMSRQPYYLTDPWIGGTDSRPPAGKERGLVQRPSGATRHLEFVIFEMIYVPIVVNSNPQLGSSTPLSKEGAPPSRVPAHWFAGAWRGKLGDGGFELVLHQSGSQVTGRINISSVIFVIKDGRADGNKLRFTIVRAGMPLPNGARLPDEVLGAGELVLDEGGKSFTGNILGTAVTGALIAR